MPLNSTDCPSLLLCSIIHVGMLKNLCSWVGVLPPQFCSHIPNEGHEQTVQSPVIFTGSQVPPFKDSMTFVRLLHLLARKQAHFPMMQSNARCSDFESTFAEVKDYWHVWMHLLRILMKSQFQIIYQLPNEASKAPK